MRFTTQLSHITHGGLSFTASDGVIDIPAEHVDKFAVFIECGWLVPAPDVAEVVDAPVEQPRKRGRRNG